MIKVKGTGVSAWVRSKLWFSLNMDTLIHFVGGIILTALWIMIMFGIMAIMPD